jgi:hypothetical protein
MAHNVGFSGSASTFVPWHFIHHPPLQPVVMRSHGTILLSIVVRD